MKIEATIGEFLGTVAKRAVDLVTAGEAEVSFDFNRILVTVRPGMCAEDVCDYYRRESDAQREAYIASPEYKASLAKAQELEREKTAKRAVALDMAPQSMSLKDPEAWKAMKAMNKDGYGGAVMEYAERWARLMEGAMAEGETVKSCAESLSFLADVDGITGFMYGAAVSTLSRVWTHGEELRRWHNKDVSPGDRGDLANENGSVLNPALLTIRG